MSSTKSLANKKLPYLWAIIRILVGFVFLWAFLDKMFGLGFATCRTIDPLTKADTVNNLCEKSVIGGGSPTEGFLLYGTSGPLQDFYTNLAGNSIVDILFMAGLGLIGACLMVGVGVRVATTTGVLLLMMMWSAALPGDNNPFVDDHIIYSVALMGVLFANKEQVWGLGKWWSRRSIVEKYPVLQ